MESLNSEISRQSLRIIKLWFQRFKHGYRRSNQNTFILATVLGDMSSNVNQKIKKDETSLKRVLKKVLKQAEYNKLMPVIDFLDSNDSISVQHEMDHLEGIIIQCIMLTKVPTLCTRMKKEQK